MGTEYEKKFRATPELQRQILETCPGQTLSFSMQTTYYDTRDRALGRLRQTLRIRLENGQPVCTLKTPGKGDMRGEWETPCGSIEKALPRLRAMGAPVDAMEGMTFLPVCRASFTRTARTLQLPEGVLEIACDIGSLSGGGHSAPLCEIEVELKEGEPSLADSFSQALTLKYDLVPEPLSKFARALALAEEDPDGTAISF